MPRSPSGPPARHGARLARWLDALIEPVPAEARRLLRERWEALPEAVRGETQVLGRQVVHCGYLMGPSYCSFSCTHCYLPRDANSLPLPPLAELAEQIAATREQVGPGGSIQITGGDVVDAYWRAGKADELATVIRMTADAGLNAMLMTHGQVLLDHPEYLDHLVVAAGLRRVSFHVDTTQAGRPGFPRLSLRHEADLHPVRDAIVALVLGSRRRTGRPLSAAMTLTATAQNLAGIPAVAAWLVAAPERLEAIRTLAVQPEARVGRSRIGADGTVDPEDVWRALGEGLGHPLHREGLHFGHPSCNRVMSMLAFYPGPRLLELTSPHPARQRDLAAVLATIGGAKGQAYDAVESVLRKLSALARRPRAAAAAVRYALGLLRGERALGPLLAALIRGRARGLNLVMHSFMHAAEIAGPRSALVEERLAACSFRGAVRRDGRWTAVSMCEMNAIERPQQASRTAARPGDTAGRDRPRRSDPPKEEPAA